MNMKNVLIYFRKDALLEQRNMPSRAGKHAFQSREGYFPRARGGVYPKSDPIVAGATRAAGLLTHSCSTTKNLPEGAVLYTGIKKIEVKNEDKTKPGEAALEEVEAALAYPQQRLAGKLLDPGAFSFRPVGLQRFREQEREGRQVDL